MKRLIVNADDFGFTPEVNAGIVQAHTDGILTATTLMANGSAFDDAVRLARLNPALDIGVHLVLVGGPSLARPGAALPASLPAMLMRLAGGGLRVEQEFTLQVERVLAAGIQPSHLDTHKHTHLARPVLDAVIHVARKHGIRWIRRPFDFAGTPRIAPWGRRLSARALAAASRVFDSRLNSELEVSAARFCGFEATGYLDTSALLRCIEALPEGVTELMCHPGLVGETLRSAPTRLRESRQTELTALTAPETRRAVRDLGIELTSFRLL